MRSLAGCLYVRACPANTGSLRIAGDAVLINGLSERIVADILGMYGMNMNKYKNEIMISSRIKIRTNEAPVAVYGKYFVCKSVLLVCEHSTSLMHASFLAS